METLDIILTLCFVPCLVNGLCKGFVAQVFALASILLGAWLSFRFSKEVCVYLEPLLNVSPTILNLISFTAIIIITIVLMYLLGRLVSGLFKLVMLGWLDKLLGLAFSLIWGTLAIGLVVMLFDTLNGCVPLVKQETLDASILYNPLKDVAYAIFPYLKELMFKQ